MISCTTGRHTPQEVRAFDARAAVTRNLVHPNVLALHHHDVKLLTKPSAGVRGAYTFYLVKVRALFCGAASPAGCPRTACILDIWRLCSGGQQCGAGTLKYWFCTPTKVSTPDVDFCLTARHWSNKRAGV